MKNEIKIEKFQGPLALLLDLIEQNKLDIAEVSLKEVTDQYLAKIEERRNEIDAGELADWLLVAAKLLFLKSRSLLPELASAEEGEMGLEEQLRMYKAYRDAAHDIKNIVRQGNFAFSREPFKLKTKVAFTPPEKCASGALLETMKRILANLEKTIIRLPKATLRQTVSLAERINELKNLLLHKTKVGFRELAGGNKSTADIVVSFLALLELIKQRHIWAEQENGSDIIINKY